MEDKSFDVRPMIDTLGFRLSDDVGDGTLVFTRCNPDHHGVGVGRGPRTGLNHYAWEVESLGTLGQLGQQRVVQPPVTGTRTVLSRPIRLLRPSPRVSFMRAALERVVEQHRALPSTR